MEKNKNVVEMHSTWLAVNSIIGCTNGCKYCFLQATGDNTRKPKIIVPAKEAINQLMESKYYNPEIPIFLVPNTDPFLNESNIKEVHQLLECLAKLHLPNPITLSTKCLIPLDFVEYLSSLTKDGMKIVIYLSYSGLGKKYEPNVKHEDIESNFINLAKYHIPIINYFRTFIPENSDPKKIKEILDFVSKYTNVSVTTGLALKEDFIDKIDFWDVTKTKKSECLGAISLWPKAAYDYLFENYTHSQNNFQTNTCALAEILKKPSPGYYNTNECLKYNHCSQKQRELCAKYQNDNLFIPERLHLALTHLGIDDKNIEIIIKKDSILLKNVDLKAGDASYLTFVLNKKVTLDKKRDDDNAFNSSFTNSKYLIIK